MLSLSVFCVDCSVCPAAAHMELDALRERYRNLRKTKYQRALEASSLVCSRLSGGKTPETKPDMQVNTVVAPGNRNVSQ